MEDSQPTRPPLPDTTELDALSARVRATRFPDGKFVVHTNDDYVLGRWRVCTVLRADPTPVGPIVWAWVGPQAATRQDHLIVEAVPLSRAQLRLLLEEVGPLVRPRDVAMVVVQTDGVAHGLRDVLTGDPQGEPGPILPRLHGPRVEPGLDRRLYAFWARDLYGATARWLAELDGDGGLELHMDPAAAQTPRTPGTPWEGPA